MKSSNEKLIENKVSFGALLIIGFAVLPFLYGEGIFSIGDINMLGKIHVLCNPSFGAWFALGICRDS